MVFDMDMHDPKADISKLEKMLRFFNDSTDRGKLYINYPMMESYRHLTSLNDRNFKDRRVSISQFPDYKAIVEKEGHKGLKDLRRCDKATFRPMIDMHLKKSNRILSGTYALPSSEKFLSWEGADILKKQQKSMDEDGSLFVLNTSLFNVVDYRPGDFLRNDDQVNDKI